VRPSTRRDIARVVLGLGALGLAASLIALLAGLGLDNADKLSSVLGMLCSLSALAVAGLTLRAPRTRMPAAVHSTAWGRRRVPAEVLDLLAATASAANSPHSLLIDDRHTAVSATYVRQRIEVPRAEAGPEARRPDQNHFLPPGQQPRIIPVRRPLDGTLDTNRHVFLEGGPGSGKSTTAAQLCRQLAEGWLHGDPAAAALSRDPVLPVLVTARQLADHPGLPWDEALAAAVSGALGGRLAQRFSTGLLAGTVDGVPWLVVVDGLDEVPSDERNRVIGQLAARTAADDQRYRLVVTSRPLAGSASALFGAGPVGHYTLVPFDRALLTEFARRWFTVEGAADADDAATRFVSEVRASGLLDVAATPLLAVVALAVYADSADRTLPRNRHDLYERYLQYLEGFNRERRATALAKLTGVLSTGQGSPVAEALYDRLDDLIEHLAVERVTSRAPLVPRAVAWLGEHGVPGAGPPPLRWNDHVLEALAASGLITRRGNAIDFLHLTFAEHLAARVHARRLPARFDAGDDDWRRWVRRAMQDEHAAGTAVLTRWTRDHPPAELLDSLLAGAQPANLVAARLVAEGAAVTEGQLEACLAVLEQRIRSGPFSEPGDLVRRFPAGALVSGWLRRLVADDALRAAGQVALCGVHADRIDGSRPEMIARLWQLAGPGQPAKVVAEAARAILELVPRSGDEVAAALADRLEDPVWLPGERVTIVSVLLECGEQQHERAFTVLREAMTHPAADVADVTIAAETLAEAGAVPREQLSRILLDVIETDRAEPYYRMDAVETLVALDPARRDDAAALLHEMALRDDEHYWAVDAAVRLARISPAHRESAIARLTAIAQAPSAPAYQRIDAAGQLLALDPLTATTAADLLSGLVLAPAVGPDELVSLMRWLTWADGESGALVLGRLREVRGGLAPGSHRWLLVTIAMAACDVTHHAEAEAALHDIVADPASAGELFMVVDLLEFHGSGPAERIMAGLLGWATSAAQPVGDRTRLMEAICAGLPRYASQVIPDARRLATSPAVTAGERARLLALAIRFDRAWSSFVKEGDLALLGHGSQEAVHLVVPRLLADSRTRAATRELVVGWLADRHSDLRWRLRLARDLSEEVFGDRAAAEDSLMLMLEEPTAGDGERLDVAAEAGRRGRAGRARAATVLGETLNDPHRAAEARLGAAVALDSLKIEADGLGVARELSRDPLISPRGRCQAALTLASLLEPGSAEPAMALLDTVRELPDDPYGNGTIAKALLSLVPDRRDLATVYANRAIRQGGWEAPEAAKTLMELNDAADLRADLAALAGDRGCDTESVVRAAERLSWALTGDATELTTVLWRVANDRNGSSEHRVKTLRLLLSRSGRDRQRAARMLGAAVRHRPADEPSFGTLDPLAAAEALLAAGPAQAEAAGAALEAVLRDIAETTGRRYRAAMKLVDSAATAHRETVLSLAGPALSGLGTEASVVCGLAEVVHRFDPARRAEAAAVLDRLAEAGNPVDRLHAAAALLRLEPPDPRGRRILCELATDNDLTDEVQVAAAERLSSGDDVDRAALAEAMRGLMRSPGRLTDRVWAARTVCEAVPADRGEGIAFLTEVARAAGVAAPDRVRAAVALARVGWDTAERSAVLGALLADAGLHGSARSFAGWYLGHLPGPDRDTARRDVLRLPNPTDRLDAAIALASVPGDCRADGLSALRRLAGDDALVAAYRLRACTELIAQGDHDDRAAAATALAALIDDPRSHDWARTRGLLELSRSGAVTVTETARRLWRTLNDPGAGVEVRRWSAESLAELDAAQARHARNALTDLAGAVPDARTSARVRRSARTIDLAGVQPG
jgi:hypothetical protein